jgi:succinate dehydrogenase / fumarate reductase flavoprotein subunit
MALDSKIPAGSISEKWTKYKDKINLVNPANKRNIDVIIVGTGLAGGFCRCYACRAWI